MGDDDDPVRVTRFALADQRLAVISVPTRPLSGVLTPLTNAERDVVERLLGGCSNAEIASARHTSAHTVANQIASIFDKLSVGSRSELGALLGGSRGECTDD